MCVYLPLNSRYTRICDDIYTSGWLWIFRTTFHLPFLNYLPQFSVDVVISSKPDVVNAVLPHAEVLVGRSA